MSSFDQFEPSATPYGNSYTATLTNRDLISLLDKSHDKARIVLMGTRRSGKSSIQKVVFHKLLPHETLFLDSTNEIIPRDISTSSLVQLQLLDFPGNYQFSENKNENSVSAKDIFNRKSVLVFVIDAQDEETYTEAIEYFIYVAKQAYSANHKIEIDVLIHKTEDHKFM